MKREALGKFILSQIKDRHVKELASASAAPAPPVAPDPNIEGIREFLRGQPFGCHTEAAAKFAQKLTGKRIRLSDDNPNKGRMGRLRLGIIVGNKAGHSFDKGTPILSLSRSGAATAIRQRPADAPVCVPAGTATGEDRLDPAPTNPITLNSPIGIVTITPPAPPAPPPAPGTLVDHRLDDTYQYVFRKDCRPMTESEADAFLARLAPFASELVRLYERNLGLGELLELEN